jgi:hypothetical protein
MIAGDLLVREAEALIASGQVATALSLIRRRGTITHAAGLSPAARDSVVTALSHAGAVRDAVDVLAAAAAEDQSAVPALAAMIVHHRFWQPALPALAALAERHPDDEPLNGLLVFALIETGAFAAAAAAREAFTARRRARLIAQLPDETPADRALTAWMLLKTGDSVGVRRLIAEHAIPAPAELDLDCDVASGLSSPGEARTPVLAGPRRPLVLAMTVRDEVDILEANLDWHFAHGIDAAIVTDNGSVDGTRALLDRLATRLPLIVIDEPVQDMDQSKWSTRMVWLAREAFDADWVLLGDADEFFHPAGGSFAAAIAAATSGWFSDANVLVLQCHLMLIDADIGVAGTPPFHAAQHCLVNPLPRWDHAYVSAGYNLLSVMTQIQKVWVRAASLPIVLPGNHLAIARTAKLAPAPEIGCLHFSYRDFARWQAKQNRFVDGFARNTAPIDQSSVTYWAQNQSLWADTRGAEAIYRRLQFGTPFHRWLAETGRIIPQSAVSDFIASGVKPAPGPLSAAEIAHCRAVLAGLDQRLPRCLR